MDTTTLRRKQIERRLVPWRRLGHASQPKAGWIRTIRQVLGMSATQLAARLGVTRQTLADYEQAERSGRVTLDTLRKVAAAMQCELVYALVPRTTISRILEEEAHAVAEAEARRVGHTMQLEAQGTEAESLAELVRYREAELLANLRQLWRSAVKPPRDDRD